MKIKYLGTAAAEGWPALYCHCQACKRAKEEGGKNIRTRSQVIVDDKILIDFPPDTYMHMLQQKIDLPSIKTLLITHSHQDHFYASDIMLRSKHFAHNLEEVLHIYGNEKVEEVLEAARVFIGGSMGSEVLVAYYYQEPFKTFCREGYRITPLLARHNPKEKCYIYILEKDGKNMLYAHDTGFFPQETWEYIKGRYFNFVSVDCTLLRIRDGHNHMGLEDIIRLKGMMEQIGCIDSKTRYVISHFSHNKGLLHEEIEAYVEGKNIEVAFDGLEIFIK